MLGLSKSYTITNHFFFANKHFVKLNRRKPNEKVTHFVPMFIMFIYSTERANIFYNYFMSAENATIFHFIKNGVCKLSNFF